VDKDTVHTLARLVRLRLSPEQEERARDQMGRLLEAFQSLQALDTEGVEPSAYPLPLHHRSRSDEPGPVLTQEEVLANAPRRRSGSFLVPRIVEG